MMITDERREQMIERLVQWIDAKGLRSPAILFLGASKPLAPVGSHLLMLFQPLFGFVGPMFGWFEDSRALADYALLLEDEVSVDRILAHLEHPSVE